MTQATHTTPIADDHARSPLRALGSLTSAQADQIVAGLSSLAGTWDIERHESCDGHLSLLVATPPTTPPSSSTATTPASASASCSATLRIPAHTATPPPGEAVSAIKDIAASPTIHDMRKSA